jgi:hypothetical protein
MKSGLFWLASSVMSARGAAAAGWSGSPAGMARRAVVLPRVAAGFLVPRGATSSVAGSSYHSTTRRPTMHMTLRLAAFSMAMSALAGCTASRQPAQQTTAEAPVTASGADGTGGLTAASAPDGAADQPAIPRGAAPTIDGTLGAGEWSDAASAAIQVEDGWEIGIRYKWDDANLYVAFSNLKPAEGKELYPEILVDVQGDASPEWSDDDWWIHISYNDCDSKGRPNVWQCAKEKPGWSANNFPLSVPGVVEAQISWETLGLVPDAGKSLGLAFDVTDTRKDYYLWPAGAALDSPKTWASVRLDP